MDERILKKLYETFQLSSRQGTGGMTFKYVPNEDVINRMNDTFQGDWSTTVKFRDVIDDQVILEVEVSIVDPDTQMKHSHTGFGSQQIMRYNSGQNAGKIIDIGNGYKGALAKAIVNACTRWGVGLFKESNPYGEDSITAVGETQAEVVIPPVLVPTALPAPVPAAPPTTAAPDNIPMEPTTASPPLSPYTIETTVAPVPPMPPTAASPTSSPHKIETTAPPAMPMPPTMVVAPPVVEIPTVPMPAIVETITTFAPPMAPEQPVAANISLTQELPKIPVPAMDVVSTAPELPLSSEGLSGIGISDVQRVALNGILTMNNAQYTELAQEAFQANGINKAVPNKEDLNYDEAVVVIKFGNDKYRKNR